MPASCGFAAMAASIISGVIMLIVREIISGSCMRLLMASGSFKFRSPIPGIWEKGLKPPSPPRPWPMTDSRWAIGLFVYCIPALRFDGTPVRAADEEGAVAAAGVDPGLAAPLTRCKVWPFCG